MNTKRKPFQVLALSAALLAGVPFQLSADTFEIGVDKDVRAAIKSLRPGDELVLETGVYVFDRRFNITLRGEGRAPIVLRARDGADVLFRMKNPKQNVIEIQDSRYVELRGIRFTGGSHGIRLMNSDFITIEECEVFETGDVAISANAGGTYEGLLLRSNHIHHTNGTGEGMYLGCNNDNCRVKDSVIEFNHIHHTNRDTVTQGDGIELKEGSSGNVIRHNVVHDTNYPGILTYSARDNGPANVIEGNLIWNTNDHGIQSAADAIIRNNIVLGSTIGLQPHQTGAPSNQEVIHNTIVNTGDGIVIRGARGKVLVANNAVYSQSGTAIRVVSGNRSLVSLSGNIGLGGLSGASTGMAQGYAVSIDFVSANFLGSPPSDLYPRAAGALIGAATLEYATKVDFNGRKRVEPIDAGAYEFVSIENPGWRIAAEIKRLSVD